MKDMTAPNGPAMALAQATILIVDDVPDNLAVLGELLRQSGYQVKVANSGRAALRFAAQLPRPDLILLDVMMPEMDGYRVLLARSAPLHDIGKVGIPDAILQKPGKLDAEEWEIMKTHACLGAEAIEQADLDSQKQLAFLTLAREIARWHHERWDGAGYPDGLQGEAIPVSARLMALADVFDALISPRVYKAPIPLAQACEIMRAGRGSHFDPDACDAFLDVFEQMGEIARSHMDVC